MAIGTVYGPPPTRNSGPGVVMLTWGVGAGGALAGTDTTAACLEQRAGKMAEMQYSSIMDYGGRFNAEVFIENGRFHGETVVKAIAGGL